MKYRPWNWTAICRPTLVAGLVTVASCSLQAPPPPTAPSSNTPPVGRFQIAPAPEGERSTTLILVDTTTGETWYFHPPQGPLFNGFWGDVPRVTSPGETWRQAFQTLLQGKSQSSADTNAPSAPIR